MAKKLKNNTNVPRKDQYGKFLHEIQKQKMKEMWDNKEDELWEH